jgi:hypothetical protein
VVVFRPGRRTTELEQITLDAIELVDHATLMRRNSIHRYPPELRRTIKLVARVKRIIRRQANEKLDG